MEGKKVSTVDLGDLQDKILRVLASDYSGEPRSETFIICHFNTKFLQYEVGQRNKFTCFQFS